MATYALNKQLIIDLFCINKGNEALQCEGSCFMKEQLSQEEPSPDKAPARETVRDYELLLFTTVQGLSFSLFGVRPKEYVQPENERVQKPFPASIFHPPQFC